MFATNLKVVLVVVLTLSAYALMANMIPQIESEVPEELDLSGEVTTEQLVSAGDRLYGGAGGCTACHGLGTRAPNLLKAEGSLGTIGTRCGDRAPDLGCKEYLYQSLVEPSAYVVEGYNPIMPEVRRVLSEAQIWTLVAFMQSQGGEVTVTPDDLPAAENGDEAETGADESDGPSMSTTTDPVELLIELGCLGCHQLNDRGNAIGPPLTGMGARQDAAYIRESILDPGAEIAQGYEAFGGMMPMGFGERMTAAQLEAIVQFLAAQR